MDAPRVDTFVDTAIPPESAADVVRDAISEPPSQDGGGRDGVARRVRRSRRLKGRSEASEACPASECMAANV